MLYQRKENWDTFSVKGKPIYNRGLSHYFTKNRGLKKEVAWEISCFKRVFEQK